MIQVEHFETGIKTFDNEEQFIIFVQSIFTENEDWMEMSVPKTFDDCKNYIIEFCDNFTYIIK